MPLGFVNAAAARGSDGRTSITDESSGAGRSGRFGRTTGAAVTASATAGCSVSTAADLPSAGLYFAATASLLSPSLGAMGT